MAFGREDELLSINAKLISINEKNMTEIDRAQNTNALLLTTNGKLMANLASLRAQLAAAKERIEQLQRAFPPCHVCKAKVGEIHSEICSVEPGEHTVEHAQFFMESQISSSRAQLAKKEAECERLREARDMLLGENNEYKVFAIAVCIGCANVGTCDGFTACTGFVSAIAAGEGSNGDIV
jgi:chromosome segregation ATPase